MVRLTGRAIRGFRELLWVHNAEEGRGVRLVPTTDGRLGMLIDAPGASDQIIHAADGALLFVEQRFAHLLDGTELDCFRTRLDGRATTVFNLRRPATAAQAAPPRTEPIASRS